MKILEIVWQPTYWQGLSCGKPTKNRSTHIIGPIHKKAGEICFAKMPWQCTETFLWQCTHPFDVLYCPPAVFTDHLFFEGQFNHQIMEKQFGWKAVGVKTIVCNCFIRENCVYSLNRCLHSFWAVVSLEESKQIVSIGAKAANRKQFSKNKNLACHHQKLADYQNLKLGFIIDFIRT